MTTIGRLTPAPKPLEVLHAASMLTLPWPPSVNAYKMPVNMGGRIVLVLTKRARQYRLDVAAAIAQQLGARRISSCYATPVQVDIEFRAPDRRSRDIDNHAKMVLDGMVAAGLLKDDALIDVLNLRRGSLLRDGCANVLIAPLDRQPDPVQQALDLVDPADEPHF